MLLDPNLLLKTLLGKCFAKVTEANCQETDLRILERKIDSITSFGV